MNYTYLLRCCDGSLYCGWTNSLEERILAHNSGRGAKYTKARRPVTLAYYEEFETKAEAMRREAAIKRLTKAEKESLAAGKPLAKAERGQAAVGRRFTKAEEEPAAGKPFPGTKEEAVMKIIVSPAKKMQVRGEDMPWGSLPVFQEEARELLHVLKGFSEEELRTLFKANQAITRENYLRYASMDLDACLTPAALAYVGIQYQHMAPQIFTARQWDYVCRSLRILSGFYGILRADDGIVPYRLEMQARLSVGVHKNLYEFWGDKLYRELEKDGPCEILNLASKEYSRAVEPYLKPGDVYVTCVFGSMSQGKVKVKATEAKMARGEMVRYLAEREARSAAEAREFDRMGFSYCPALSSETEYVFVREEGKQGSPGSREVETW